MYNIITLALVTSLYISAIHSTCSKTFKSNNTTPQTVGTHENGNDTNNLTITDRSDSSSRSSKLGYAASSQSQSQPQYTKIQAVQNDLDSLRLEYYKYKILSHLGIATKNPDKLNPKIDQEFVNDLISSSGITHKQDETRSISTHRRQRRSLACNQVKSNKDACCLETFYLNFTDIGWDKWILYPAGYNANYCHGQCDLSHARYYHSTLLSKFSSDIGLCCSPRQMAPLRLLYIDEENKVHQKSVPDMIVESCDCA